MEFRMKINMDSIKYKRFKFSGVRYLFAAVTCLGIIVNFAVRVNLSVAIVAMVNSTAVYKRGTENALNINECITETKSFNSSKYAQKIDKEGEFSWSPGEQGVLLGSFYYGYLILQIPGGWIADKYSGKWVFGLGTFIPALLSLLTPVVARLDFNALLVLRALEGLAQGVMFPSVYAMLSDWTPPSETGFLISLVLGGVSVGIGIGMFLTGWLCSLEFLGGWPSAFYVIGIFGCLWFVLWCLVVTDTPHEHPCMTREELEYITLSQENHYKINLPPFPWYKVMTSVPFWAFLISGIGVDWGFIIMISELPTFFATILNFNIEESGFLSALPHILKLIAFLFAGFTFDVLQRKRILTVPCIRKLSALIANVTSSLFLLGVCLAGCSVNANVIFLMSFATLYGFNVTGIVATVLDMSPEYSGTLTGIANLASSIMGFIAPLVVGILTEEQQTLGQWQIVFGISAAIQAASGFIFIFFSTADRQDWAGYKKTGILDKIL